MIRVYDNEPTEVAAVVLTTVNCDGILRYWLADDIEEFHRWWWEEDYDGPADDDEVLRLTINEGCGRGNIQTFEDIVTEYGFNKEIKSPEKVTIQVISGTPEYKRGKGTCKYCSYLKQQSTPHTTTLFCERIEAAGKLFFVQIGNSGNARSFSLRVSSEDRYYESGNTIHLEKPLDFKFCPACGKRLTMEGPNGDHTYTAD